MQLREVIAFPKSATGGDLMVGAPSEPTKEQLHEYHIDLTPNASGGGAGEGC